MQGRMIHPAGHSLSSYLHEVCANLKHNFSKKYGLPLLKVTFLLGQWGMDLEYFILQLSKNYQKKEKKKKILRLN